MNPRLSTPGGVLIGVPDGYLPAAAVAIQVHSRAFHAGVDEHGRDRWSATVEADARYTRHGILVVAVTPITLRYEPDRFLSTLVDVVAAQGARPLPDVRITSGP